MQVTDAMVEGAIEAYAATDSHTVLLDGNAMRAALTAALAEMWRPISEDDPDIPALYGCRLANGRWYQEIFSSPPPKGSLLTHRAELLPAPPKTGGE